MKRLILIFAISAFFSLSACSQVSMEQTDEGVSVTATGPVFLSSPEGLVARAYNSVAYACYRRKASSPNETMIPDLTDFQPKVFSGTPKMFERMKELLEIGQGLSNLFGSHKFSAPLKCPGG